ncbi:unnamed protein product [Cylicostephanus goldi]|uniref:diacylglycerol O-acyltransferase n=1 Tax=Cylicostephanus goldi TaxID=71465 RepID=A0A3P7N3H1_CYLGO|nr:unnamed protein product [Cylicostephanus goldi]
MHMFRLWAYYGMMSQIPLSLITDHVIKGGRAGNIIVWLSLILGQPLAILMYMHDWYVMHQISAEKYHPKESQPCHIPGFSSVTLNMSIALVSPPHVCCMCSF